MKKNIIEALQDVMKRNNYISKDDIKLIAKKLNKAETEVYGVATFYSQFSLVPKAKYNIEVCTGTACFVLGSNEILEFLKKKFNVKENELTSNNKYKFSTVRCLGCCTLAPVVSINGKIFGKMSASKMNDLIKKIDKEGLE